MDQEVSPVATAPVASPPPSIRTSAAAAAPTKAVGTPARKPEHNSDVTSVKKNLFPAGHHRPPSQDPPSKSYQEKEERLWTKLFSI